MMASIVITSLQKMYMHRLDYLLQEFDVLQRNYPLKLNVVPTAYALSYLHHLLNNEGSHSIPYSEKPDKEHD